ncbi:MAG: response regulator [Castellaniella sp.]|nr:response regulator [Castellaniella sp.]
MKTVYLVDDDEIIRDALGALFRSRGLALQVFADGPAFLAAWGGRSLARLPACLLIDVRMPGMSGLELLAKLKEGGLAAHHAVIFLTGHGDIPMAVEALKSGAYDFLEKPFSDNKLVDRVLESLDYVDGAAAASSESRDLSTRLTPREYAIAERIVAGQTNKQIGDALFISVRTVEVHRARIFAKLEIKSAIGLAQLWVAPHH